MRGNTARMLLPGIVVLALVSVVAIAATGSTDGGSGEIRSPAAVLIDTVLSLILVALLAAAALLIYGFTRRTAAPEYGRSKPSRGVLTGILALIALLVSLVYLRPTLPPTEGIEGPVLLEDPPAVPPLPPGGSYEPSFAWLPVTIVLALAAAGVAAFILAERRRRGPARAGEGLAEQLAVALDDTLDDLRAESDPRRAVIAAYARLERVLAAHGVARHPAETPEEYLARILGELEVDQKSVRRLTVLFSRAKFSPHAVDFEMKEEAIGALGRVRDELRIVGALAEPGPATPLRRDEASA